MKFMKDSFSQRKVKRKDCFQVLHLKTKFLKKLRDTPDPHQHEKTITEERNFTNGCKIIKTYHRMRISSIRDPSFFFNFTITTIKKPFVLIPMKVKNPVSSSETKLYFSPFIPFTYENNASY